MKGKLFNLIPFSGASTSYWGYWNTTLQVGGARELASGAHCNYPNTTELVECLRTLPPEELTVLRLHFNDTWRPVVDNKYFPATAEELVKDNHDFNLFMSDLPDDGYAWLFEDENSDENLESTFRDWLGDVTVSYDDTYGKMPFLQEVFFHGFYPFDNLENFDWSNNVDWQNVTRFIDTDLTFENGVYKGAKLHAEAGGTVYYYGLDGPNMGAGEWAPEWLRFTHGDDLAYYFGHGLVQRSEWHDGPHGGHDCPNSNPTSCRVTPLQIDLSEYAMHLLSNIAHSGNPQKPRAIPDYLNVEKVSDWVPFSIKTKMKNWVYLETFKSDHLEQKAVTVPDHRLNLFYMFNDLVSDLEIDRKIHCDATQASPKLDRKLRKGRKTISVEQFKIDKQQFNRVECSSSDDQNISMLTTSAGCLMGESSERGEQYRNVPFGKQSRFETSTLFTSTDIIDTATDRKLCPFADLDGNVSDNLGPGFNR